MVSSGDPKVFYSLYNWNEEPESNVIIHNDYVLSKENYKRF